MGLVSIKFHCINQIKWAYITFVPFYLLVKIVLQGLLKLVNSPNFIKIYVYFLKISFKPLMNDANNVKRLRLER